MKKVSIRVFVNNLRVVLLGVLAFSVGEPSVFARAIYVKKAKMIRDAEAILVVNITKVETVEKKPTSGWNYRQKATGNIEQIIKGNISGDIEIFGMEDFRCAWCEFKTGRSLVFLNKSDQGFWHSMNWQFGNRPIMDGKLEWFKNESNFKMEPKSLDDVVKDIESTLKKASPNKPK